MSAMARVLYTLSSLFGVCCIFLGLIIPFWAMTIDGIGEYDPCYCSFWHMMSYFYILSTFLVYLGSFLCLGSFLILVITEVRDFV